MLGTSSSSTSAARALRKHTGEMTATNFYSRFTSFRPPRGTPLTIDLCVALDDLELSAPPDSDEADQQDQETTALVTWGTRLPRRYSDALESAWPEMTFAAKADQFKIDLRSLDFDLHCNDEIYIGDDALRRAHQMISNYKVMNKSFEEKQPSFAYATLITNASYLPGVICLLHSLRKSGGKFPLVVLYTKNLTAYAVAALQIEEKDPSNFLELYCIDPLLPPGHHNLNVADARFADTWTKLRVFQLYRRFTTVAYLDADMIMSENDNIDYIFEYARYLPKTTIAAVHDCVCSQPEYGPKKCLFSQQQHITADYAHITARQGDTGPETLFNSGMFLFHPTKKLWDAILYYFNNSTKLGEFRFPDQDFLVTFFKYRFTGIPWQWNAVKTMAQRHSNVFDADRVCLTHFIVDKPWAKRVDADSPGIHSPLHATWWAVYDDWRAKKEQKRERKMWELVNIVAKHTGDRNGVRPIDGVPKHVWEGELPLDMFTVVGLDDLTSFRGYGPTYWPVVVGELPMEVEEMEEEDEEALKKF
ncbi:hypothetical protein CKM354_001071900 [Cercospora kikuchii]|uniref:Nucleotide-diphospho-sugar transferase n=1 Tax=Cercospora kikuchii TaxID=84275 RepID=A0A9P3CU42_9PEZI|nr:uncharacterized protein CKM354_001071900 [Cercospora kikuchii]GIZ47632.1 hypothetical protein CKM354_001071900 [Cercospora kikuchii]